MLCTRIAPCHTLGAHYLISGEHEGVEDWGNGLGGRYRKSLSFKLAISFAHALVEHLRFTQLHVLYSLLLEKMFSDVLWGKETH